MNIKSLLIGAVAGLVALSGAYAKDVSGEPPGVNVAYVAEMVVPTLSVDTHVSILDTVVSVPTSDPAVSVQGAEPQASVVAAEGAALGYIHVAELDSEEPMITVFVNANADMVVPSLALGGSKLQTARLGTYFYLWRQANLPFSDQKGDKESVIVDRSTETGI